MRRLVLIASALLGIAAEIGAQTSADDVSIDRFNMGHDGKYMSVDMTMDLSELDVAGNRAVLLTPRIVNGADSLELPSVGIYGRRRWLVYVRNDQNMITGKSEESYKVSEMPDSISYNKVFPYRDWMNGATLSLQLSDYGCCGRRLSNQMKTIGEYVEKVEEAEEFIPELVYAVPAAERVKSRSIEGSAFIDFLVNDTAIASDYRNNASELGKIRATIDSVRNDSDVTITSVWLKGYASPDGRYAVNEKLAIGRTESLKEYIMQLYRFESGTISTGHEAEDWAGLRKYIEQSSIGHRDEILAIIDGSLEPDAKEWKIKSTYKTEYRFLLDNVYPSLRHTDYRIAYHIRNYHDVDEIRKVMHTQPQKLSLNEFYIVAQECGPGTDEFTEVFETAVRMYPSDEIANLNAANAAMLRGEIEAAGRYLNKAGNSPEAIYAKGALAILIKDYDTARNFLLQAKDMNVEQAAPMLEKLDKVLLGQ